MSVWLTIPSKRPPEEAERVLKLWRERGYKIALLRDGLSYGGYALSVNQLICAVRRVDPAARWFVAAGDDVEPDLNHSADETAQQCEDYFLEQSRGGRIWDLEARIRTQGGATFGVMQPTGDRWGDTPESRKLYGHDRGAYIDRVAGSAWIGLEFVQRAYCGKGPLWPGYFHMFADEELQEVATRFGCFLQRRDFTQVHRHWGRGPEGNANQPQGAVKMPEFLKKANDGFGEARRLFDARKAAGFPGSELLP